MYPFGVVLGVLGLVVAGAAPAPIPVRVFGLICLPLAWWFGTLGGRIGVDIGAADVVVRGPFGSERLTRAEIVDVGVHRWFLNMVVHFDLSDGRRLGTNLIQGVMVNWEGGTTKDILSVLGHELDAYSPRTKSRRAQPPAPRRISES
jgi:hypothetical protein